MSKTLNKLVTILCVATLFVSGIGCSPKTTQPESEKQVATVQLGNLAISVSVDGNLVMPQAFDLLFGAPGNVEDVLVEEGDFVREGTVLATLDNTSEKLDVESANNKVQTDLSNLYENVPLLPQFTEHNYGLRDPTLPYQPVPKDPQYNPYVDWGIKDSRTAYTFYYPNATALSAYSWAQDETNKAHQLYQSDNYTAAASELYVALSDLEACVQIFRDTINNPKSGLGGTAPLVPTDLPGITYLQVLQGSSFAISYILELRKVIDSIKQGQADIEKIRSLIVQGKYKEAAPLFKPLLCQVDDIGKTVIRNINVIKTHNYGSIYGKDISLYFYSAAADN
jgi:hypothetical protein